MRSLKTIIAEAEQQKIAIGHFNISDLVGLRAIFEAARDFLPQHKTPVIVGTSEGERDFVGANEAVILVKSLRERFDYPIFINADHTHSLEKIKEAVEAGYDAIIFDGSKLPLEENIAATKEAANYIRTHAPETIIEGELGYIGSSSQILKNIPEGAVFDLAHATKSDEALRFVQETGVDLFSPAVGNLHGMFANAPNPALQIARIQEIKSAVKIPLVLHGGSGVTDSDFVAAIKAGISIIHINTEIRLAWKKGIAEGLAASMNEVAPYKILEPSLRNMKAIITARLALFSGIK